jgi:hypothetical protein
MYIKIRMVKMLPEISKIWRIFSEILDLFLIAANLSKLKNRTPTVFTTKK